MKKLSLLALGVFLLTSGCTHYINSMPSSGIQLQGDTKYEVLGDTKATADIYNILLFFTLPTPEAYETGNLGKFQIPTFLDMINPALKSENAATYKAIKNFEGADEIICPKYSTEVTQLIIFSKATTTVTAKAIKIKQ